MNLKMLFFICQCLFKKLPLLYILYMGLTTWDDLGWQNLKNGTPGHISVARREFKNERNDLKRVVYCTRSSRSAVRKNRGNTYYYNGGIHRCKYVSGRAETRGFRMIKIYRWIYIYINYFYFAFTCLRAKTHGGRQEARAGRLRAKKKAKSHRHDKYIYIYIYRNENVIFGRVRDGFNFRLPKYSN